MNSRFQSDQIYTEMRKLDDVVNAYLYDIGDQKSNALHNILYTIQYSEVLPKTCYDTTQNNTVKQKEYYTVDTKQ